MNKRTLIALACLLCTACATPGPPPAERAARPDSEHIAAEIQVRRETLEPASPQTVSAATH